MQKETATLEGWPHSNGLEVSEREINITDHTVAAGARNPTDSSHGGQFSKTQKTTLAQKKHRVRQPPSRPSNHDSRTAKHSAAGGPRKTIGTDRTLTTFKDQPTDPDPSPINFKGSEVADLHRRSDGGPPSDIEELTEKKDGTSSHQVSNQGSAPETPNLTGKLRLSRNSPAAKPSRQASTENEYSIISNPTLQRRETKKSQKVLLQPRASNAQNSVPLQYNDNEAFHTVGADRGRSSKQVRPVPSKDTDQQHSNSRTDRGMNFKHSLLSTEKIERDSEVNIDSIIRTNPQVLRNMRVRRVELRDGKPVVPEGSAEQSEPTVADGGGGDTLAQERILLLSFPTEDPNNKPMQKRLEMTQELKKYQETLMLEQQRRREEEYINFHSQHMLYINNQAAGKRRGFSAILGGRTVDTSSQEKTQRGSQNLISTKASLAPKSHGTITSGLPPSRVKGLAGSSSMGLTSALQAQVRQGRSRASQYQFSQKQTGPTRRMTSLKQWGGESSAGYSRVNMKDRFANNRIKSTIIGTAAARDSQGFEMSDRPLFSPNLEATKLAETRETLRKRLLDSQASGEVTLDYGFDDDPNYDFNFVSEGARPKKANARHAFLFGQQSKAGKKQTLTDMIVQDKEREAIKAQERAVYKHQRFQEQAYKNFIDMKNILLARNIQKRQFETLDSRPTTNLINEVDQQSQKVQIMEESSIAARTVSSKQSAPPSKEPRRQKDLLKRIYHAKVSVGKDQSLIPGIDLQNPDLTEREVAKLRKYADVPDRDIDVQAGLQITGKQSEWIKQHMFKINYFQSQTKKTDGNAQTPFTHEMILWSQLVSQNGDDHLGTLQSLATGGLGTESSQHQKSTARSKVEGPNRRASMFPKDGNKAKNTFRDVDEDDEVDLTKVISDADLHGFFPLRTTKFLRKLSHFDEANKSSVLQQAKQSTISEDKATNQMAGSQFDGESLASLNLDSVKPVDFLLQHRIQPRIYKILLFKEERVKSSTSGTYNNRSRTVYSGGTHTENNSVKSRFRATFKPISDPRSPIVQKSAIQPDLSEKSGSLDHNNQQLRKSLPQSLIPTSPAPGQEPNSTSDPQHSVLRSIGGTVEEQEHGEDSRGDQVDKISSVQQDVLKLGQPAEGKPTESISRGGPVPPRRKTAAGTKRPRFTQYENLVQKFAEFLESGEYKKAQQVNLQSSKIWPFRSQYFAFNFGLQCLLMGEYAKSIQVLGQVLVREYQRKCFEPLSGKPLQEALLKNDIIRSALHNLVLAHLLLVQDLTQDLANTALSDSQQRTAKETRGGLSKNSVGEKAEGSLQEGVALGVQSAASQISSSVFSADLSHQQAAFTGKNRTPFGKQTFPVTKQPTFKYHPTTKQSQASVGRPSENIKPEQVHALTQEATVPKASPRLPDILLSFEDQKKKRIQASHTCVRFLSMLMELLDFHGVSRVYFTLDQDELDFQKMIAMAKHAHRLHLSQIRQYALARELDGRRKERRRLAMATQEAAKDQQESVQAAHNTRSSGGKDTAPRSPERISHASKTSNNSSESALSEWDRQDSLDLDLHLHDDDLPFEDDSPFLKLRIVKRVLNYERDCGGYQNSLTYKVNESPRKSEAGDSPHRRLSGRSPRKSLVVPGQKRFSILGEGAAFKLKEEALRVPQAVETEPKIESDVISIKEVMLGDNLRRQTQGEEVLPSGGQTSSQREEETKRSKRRRGAKEKEVTFPSKQAKLDYSANVNFEKFTHKPLSSPAFSPGFHQQHEQARGYSPSKSPEFPTFEVVKDEHRLGGQQSASYYQDQMIIHSVDRSPTAGPTSAMSLNKPTSRLNVGTLPTNTQQSEGLIDFFSPCDILEKVYTFPYMPIEHFTIHEASATTSLRESRSEFRKKTKRESSFTALDGEHLLAFPSRNPLSSIKDHRRNQPDETKPEEGFSFLWNQDQGKKGIVYKSTASPEARKKAAKLGSGGESMSEMGGLSPSQAAGSVPAERKEHKQDILNLSRVDKCLINMEELEMEVNLILQQQQNEEAQAREAGCSPVEEFSPEKMRLADPVHDQYVQLLKNIRNLCSDESIYSILLEQLRERSNKSPVTSTFEKERQRHRRMNLIQSQARDILVRAILRPRHLKGKLNFQSLTTFLLESSDIDYSEFKLSKEQKLLLIFREKVNRIKEVVNEEINNPVKRQNQKSYIDLAGKEIQRLLAAAKKKKKERATAGITDCDYSTGSPRSTGSFETPGQTQRKSSQKFTKSAVRSSAQSLSESVKRRQSKKPSTTMIFTSLHEGGVQSSQFPSASNYLQINLYDVFRDKTNMKSLFQKLGMEVDLMMDQIAPAKKLKDSSNLEPQTQSQKHLDEKRKLESQLVSFSSKNNMKLEQFVSRTDEFFTFLFSHYSAFFLFQKAYCLTDFLEYCPKSVLGFVDEIQEVITAIPMRFSLLSSDKYDDAEYIDIETNREFIFNREDPCHRLLSQAFRNQSTLDALHQQLHSPTSIDRQQEELEASSSSSGADPRTAEIIKGPEQQFSSEWIESVHKRFNVLSLFNFAFREYIETCLEIRQLDTNLKSPMSESSKRQGTTTPKRDFPSSNLLNSRSISVSGASLQPPVSKQARPSDAPPTQNIKRTSIFTSGQLSLLRREYRKKEAGAKFNTSLVDLTLGSSDEPIPFLQNLSEDTRKALIESSSLRSVNVGDYDFIRGSSLALDQFSDNEVLVFVNGGLDILILDMAYSQFKKNLNSQNSKDAGLLWNRIALAGSKKGGDMMANRRRASITKMSKKQSSLNRWRCFQQIGAGMAIPVVHLKKLSALYQSQLKLIVKNSGDDSSKIQKGEVDISSERQNSTGADVLVFNNSAISKKLFDPLKKSLLRKIIAQQNIDFFSVGGSDRGGKQGEETSPFLMFVLAIVCQVKVCKYSDQVVRKGEIPKALHLIIDGKAQIMYEDHVLRDVNPSQYCRKSQRKNDPSPFKHGSESPEMRIKKQRLAELAKMTSKSILNQDEEIDPYLHPAAQSPSIKKIDRRTSAISTSNMIINEGPSLEKRKSDCQARITGGEKTVVTLEDIDQVSPILSNPAPEQLNVKVNQNLQDTPGGRPTIIIEDFNEIHSESADNELVIESERPLSLKPVQSAVAKKKPGSRGHSGEKKHPMKYQRSFVEFKTISDGAYFASRVLIDEAIIKNYIKANKAKILKWIRQPYPDRIESIIRKFSIQQGILDSYNEQSESMGSKQQVQLFPASATVQLTQTLRLKSITETRQDYDLDNGSQDQDERDDKGRKRESVSGAFHLETLSKQEYKVMRSFLLSSQLSVVVKSHELKCMMIKKQDKVFFGESIKRIFDERISALEFFDEDRPMKDLVAVERIRQNNRKWDLFKKEYEEKVLKLQFNKRAGQFN